MPAKAIVIERAKPEDAATICDIRDRAWIEAYPNAELGISADDVRLNAQGRDGVFVPRRIAYLQDQSAEQSNSDLTTYVAKNAGVVLGYVQSMIDGDGKRWISAIYVAPETQGMGIGGTLLRRALQVLGDRRDIFLEVVSYNRQAIGFYEHFGFTKTDAVVPEEARRPDYMKRIPQIEMVLRANNA